MVNTPQGSLITDENIMKQSRNMEVHIKTKEDQFRKLKQLLVSDSLCLNVNFGPNVNLKIPKKTFHTLQEKEFFKSKIKITKKTELCKNWELYRNCYFKDNCSFAHGENELRVKNVTSNQKYKTKICKAFTEKMWCQFGSRCQYRHISESPKLLSYNYLSNKLANTVLFEVSKDGEQDFTQIISNFYMTNSLERYKLIYKFIYEALA